MSICPKNKSSKARRDKKKSKLENERTKPGKMQQVWRINDASQSMQGLWFIQQKRNHCSGLIF